MPYIVVREPGQVSFVIPLREGLRVGRHEQNEVVLTDHQVSRHHAQFSLSEEGWMIRDLGSRHGTLVNGEKVDARLIGEGDRIQLGNVLISLHEGEDPPEIVHQQATAIGLPAHHEGTDRRLQLVYDVSRAIGTAGDKDDLLGSMLEAILEVLGCERAMLGLAETEGRGLRRIARTRDTSNGAAEIVVSRTIIEALTVQRKALILRRDSGHKVPKTLVREQILSAMGVPLQAGSALVGFLYVDDRARADRFTPEDLEFLIALGHLTVVAMQSTERYQQATALAEALGAGGPTAELLGASEPMRHLKTQIHKYGAASANVLIRGESGTGKELIARTLHAVSSRSAQPFVTLNCAAIPNTMIESELFGYEKGAFTGAVREKRGKFVLADRGTLFLDEIGDLDLAAQAKVLRAIQEGEVQPLGSERSLRVNVRILSATHKDLLEEIAAKRFREDLYYRLNVVEIEAPPLRERGDDIEILARALLNGAASSMGKRLQGFTPAALSVLKSYDWPGNVRELRNEMERAAINAESPIVDVSDLSSRVRKGKKEEMAWARRDSTLAERFAELEPMERQLIKEALTEAGGNLSEAARLLGITRIMIKRRLDRFGLS